MYDFCRPPPHISPYLIQSLLLMLSTSASTRSFPLTGALNTDWDGEGGAKNRLKEAVDSFRLEGLIVDGVRLGGA